MGDSVGGSGRVLREVVCLAVVEGEDACVDFLAGIMELSGAWLVGSRRKVGFLASFAGSVVWVIYVFSKGHTYGLLLVCVPAAVVSLRNYVRWRREERGEG